MISCSLSLEGVVTWTSMPFKVLSEFLIVHCGRNHDMSYHASLSAIINGFAFWGTKACLQATWSHRAA